MESEDMCTREDLLDAWLSHEASRSGHPDIADCYYRQVWALCGAFKTWGVRLTLNGGPPEHRQLWAVFRWSVGAYDDIRAPWRIWLAGRPTPERAEVEARHRPSSRGQSRRCTPTAISCSSS